MSPAIFAGIAAACFAIGVAANVPAWAKSALGYVLSSHILRMLCLCVS